MTSYLHVVLFERTFSSIHDNIDDAIKSIKLNFDSFYEDCVNDDLPEDELPVFDEYKTSFTIRTIPIDTTKIVYIIMDGNQFVKEPILTNNISEFTALTNKQFAPIECQYQLV